MARYYFDFHDHEIIADTVGKELPNLSAAQHEAVRILGAFVADDHHAPMSIVVREGTERVLTVRITVEVSAP